MANTATLNRLDMYEACVPPLLRALNNLKGILAKGEAYAGSKKVGEQVILQSRLAVDMYPLVKQVQIAADIAKGAAARLSGSEVPSHPDTETTFAELYARLDKTIALLESVSESGFNNAETRNVTLKFGPKEYHFNGLQYLTGFVLPNVYFHVTTTYAILRHNGVELGKADYTGGYKF